MSKSKTLSKGNLIVMSAPSGSGKTSLAARVLQEVPQLRFSVSYTTRKPRRGERHGVEYFFVSAEEFKGMIRRRAFLEFAHVYGHYYGTSRAFVESVLQEGHDVLLDIDVQGAMKVKEKIPEALLVFVFPPSLEVLRTRLKGRGLDDDSIVEKRLQVARREIHYYKKYEYVIINEEMDESVAELKSIILAARCGLLRRMGRAQEIIKTFKER